MIPARAESVPRPIASMAPTPKPEPGLPIDANLKAEILDLWSDGFDTVEIGSEVGRHEADVHAVIVEDRAERRKRA